MLFRSVKEVVKSVRKGEKGYVHASTSSEVASLGGHPGAVWLRTPELTCAVRRIIVLAADISPVDILTHIPLLAEEANCPYIVRLLLWPVRVFERAVC